MKRIKVLLFLIIILVFICFSCFPILYDYCLLSFKSFSNDSILGYFGNVVATFLATLTALLGYYISKEEKIKEEKIAKEKRLEEIKPRIDILIKGEGISLNNSGNYIAKSIYINGVCVIEIMSPKVQSKIYKISKEYISINNNKYELMFDYELVDNKYPKIVYLNITDIDNNIWEFEYKLINNDGLYHYDILSDGYIIN